ncbi:MAG: cytochrome c [Rhodospirillales bacterium]|nr:cytochrome c [Rhodospirillales bacterium]
MSKFPRLALAVAACLAIFGPAVAQQQVLPLGRAALPAEIAAWDIDVRPDGQGLPAGKGSVKEGEQLFLEQCAACHGEFGEGAGRWPPIAGGVGSLKSESPEKTPGSYWPYASTLFDYVRRAMPYGNAQSLEADQVYAITAYLLSMSDVIPEDHVLSKENFAAVKLPNAGGFFDDDRETAERQFWGREPCMKNCKTEVKILGHARALDVTPDEKKGPKVD